MARRKMPSESLMIAAEGSDALERREALYVRLILSQPFNSAIAQQLHAKLCEVRLAQFGRPA